MVSPSQYLDEVVDVAGSELREWGSGYDGMVGIPAEVGRGLRCVCFMTTVVSFSTWPYIVNM